MCTTLDINRIISPTRAIGYEMQYGALEKTSVRGEQEVGGEVPVAPTTPFPLQHSSPIPNKSRDIYGRF
jgi:hypothetical protein